MENPAVLASKHALVKSVEVQTDGIGTIFRIIPRTSGDIYVNLPVWGISVGGCMIGTYPGARLHLIADESIFGMGVFFHTNGIPVYIDIRQINDEELLKQWYMRDNAVNEDSRMYIVDFPDRRTWSRIAKYRLERLYPTYTKYKQSDILEVKKFLNEVRESILSSLKPIKKTVKLMDSESMYFLYLLKHLSLEDVKGYLFNHYESEESESKGDIISGISVLSNTHTFEFRRLMMVFAMYDDEEIDKMVVSWLSSLADMIDFPSDYVLPDRCVIASYNRKRRQAHGFEQ